MPPEPKVQLSVRLDRRLVERIKIRAVKEGKSVQALAEDAWMRYLRPPSKDEEKKS